MRGNSKSLLGTCNKYGNKESQEKYLELMKERKREQLKKTENNASENWMSNLLTSECVRFTKQAIYGKRIFDFWIHKDKSPLGVAIEVDGNEHDLEYDEYRDRFAFARSQILVFRVRNFDINDALRVVKEINSVVPFSERRKILSNGSKQTTALINDKERVSLLWDNVRCNLCSWRTGTIQPNF